MLQLFSRRDRPAPLLQATEEQWRRWRADPLSHPDLARMSERELGDLPRRGDLWDEPMTWLLLGGSVSWLAIGNLIMFKMANFRF